MSQCDITLDPVTEFTHDRAREADSATDDQRSGLTGRDWNRLAVPADAAPPPAGTEPSPAAVVSRAGASVCNNRGHGEEARDTDG